MRKEANNEKRSEKTIFCQLEGLLMFSPTAIFSNIFSLTWNDFWYKCGGPLFGHVLWVSLKKAARKRWTTKQCGHKRSYVWQLSMPKADYGMCLISNKKQHPTVSALAAWTSWKIRGKLGVWQLDQREKIVSCSCQTFICSLRGRGMPWEYDTNAKIFKENNEALYAGLKMLAIGFDCPCVQAVNSNLWDERMTPKFKCIALISMSKNLEIMFTFSHITYLTIFPFPSWNSSFTLEIRMNLRATGNNFL